MTTTTTRARHEGADTRPVEIERSDAIDAAAGLLMLARDARRQSMSRRLRGPQFASTREGYRESATIYEMAARRVQAAADEAGR
jgi:hypothetical protein